MTPDLKTKVKLGQGIMGKSAACLLGLIPVWFLAIWKCSGNWGDLPILFAACVITGVVVWWINRMEKFAKANPAAALLEGLDYLKFHQMEAAAKGLTIEGPSQPRSDPHGPPSRPRKTRLQIKGPDEGPDP